MAFMRHHPTTIAYPTLETESIGIKNLFKLFVSFLKDADLIGCKIIAIDGKKQSNSKKANFNQEN
jgi:hypothetical protein